MKVLGMKHLWSFLPLQILIYYIDLMELVTFNVSMKSFLSSDQIQDYCLHSSVTGFYSWTFWQSNNCSVSIAAKRKSRVQHKQPLISGNINDIQPKPNDL